MRRKRGKAAVAPNKGVLFNDLFYCTHIARIFLFFVLLHLPRRLRITYSNVSFGCRHYFSSFLPLLFEDVRAQMHSALERSHSSSSVSANRPRRATVISARLRHTGTTSAPSQSTSTRDDTRVLLKLTHAQADSPLLVNDCCLIVSERQQARHLGMYLRDYLLCMSNSHTSLDKTRMLLKLTHATRPGQLCVS